MINQNFGRSVLGRSEASRNEILAMKSFFQHLVFRDLQDWHASTPLQVQSYQCFISFDFRRSSANILDFANFVES